MAIIKAPLKKVATPGKGVKTSAPPPSSTVVKPKITPKPVAAAAPTYTPGAFGANSLAQMANRRLRYTLQTGRDDKGIAAGPGFLDQQRLGKIGDINAQRVVNERDRSEGILGADRNFAARGLGRSGLLGAARGKVEAAALDREGAFSRAEEQANLDYRMANADEDFNFANDMSGLRQSGAAEDYNNWLQNNPNPGAQPAAAPTKPDWATWLRTHPWAKTPAQQKLLRASYNKMGA